MIYLDTNVFIKAIEADDSEAEIAWTLLQTVASGRLKAATSELTIAEVLPKPIANGDTELVQTYERVLRDGAGLTVVPVIRAILLKSAQIRSETPAIRLPDAIHAATALERACDMLLSNDRRLRLGANLIVLSLSTLTLNDIERLSR